MPQNILTENKFIFRSAQFLIGMSLLLYSWPPIHSMPIDPDYWWHLRTGVDFIKNHRFSYLDPYSYTAFGREWINHEWGFDAGLGFFYTLLGSAGPLIMRLLLLVAIMSLWSFELYQRTGKWKGLFLFGFLTTVPFIGSAGNLRPQLVTYFCLLCLMAIGRKYKRDRSAFIRFVPILMVGWVNLHAGFLIGLLFLSTISLEVFLFSQGTFLERVRQPIIRVSALCIFMIPLLTPYHIRLYPYLANELTANHGPLSEWQPLSLFYLPMFIWFGLVPLVVAVGAGRSKRRFGEMLFFFICVLSTIRHQRMLPILFIMGPILTLESIAMLLSSSAFGKRIDQLIAAGCLAVMVLWMTLNLPHVKSFSLEYKPFRSDYPTSAVNFLKKKAIGKNLFIDFNWGGFAIWHLYPSYLVSIDGRNVMLYGKKTAAEYIDAYRQGNVKALSALDSADLALIKNKGNMYNALLNHSAWRQIYRDDVAAIFKKG